MLTEHLIWVFLALVFFVGLTVENFATSVNLLNVLWAAAPLALLSLGLFFVLIAGNLDLSLESTFGFAPTIAILFMTQWFPDIVPPVLAVVLTLVVGCIVGLGNGVLSVVLRANAFLITLATLLLLRGAMIALVPEGVYFLPDAYVYLGRARVAGVPIAVLVALASYVLAYVVLAKHSFGKALQAIGSNQRAAHIAGVQIDRTLMLAFIVAGLCAAVGGLLQVGRIQSVSADTGQGSILLVFAAVILGGTSITGGYGRVTGVAGAVLVLAVIDNLLNLVGVDPSIRQVVFGIILLIGIYVASMQDRLRRRVTT
jgi:simple sugar transport system permease protein